MLQSIIFCTNPFIPLVNHIQMFETSLIKCDSSQRLLSNQPTLTFHPTSGVHIHGNCHPKDPEDKSILMKTTCSNLVKTQRPRVTGTAKAPVHLPHFHTHPHRLHGLTPTLQVISINALLKPAAAAAATACSALKPTIGLRNSWFSVFSFRFSFSPPFHQLQTGNLLSESYPIRLSPTVCLYGYSK